MGLRERWLWSGFVSPQPQQANYGLCLLSVLLICLPSSVCRMDCGGPGKKGGKVLWVVSLGCSRLATSDFSSVGRCGAFPCVVLLQVLLLPAQLGKTQYFYFQACGIQKKLACVARGAYLTRFSLWLPRGWKCATLNGLKTVWCCCCFYASPEKHRRRARLGPRGWEGSQHCSAVTAEQPALSSATSLRVTGTGA